MSPRRVVVAVAATVLVIATIAGVAMAGSGDDDPVAGRGLREQYCSGLEADYHGAIDLLQDPASHGLNTDAAQATAGFVFDQDFVDGAPDDMRDDAEAVVSHLDSAAERRLTRREIDEYVEHFAGLHQRSRSACPPTGTDTGPPPS